MTYDVNTGVPIEMESIDTHPVVSVGKILVVDDTAANLVAAEAALAPLERPIVTANSGQEALACLLEQDFALVLLDVNMPDMDGFETARFIRSYERTKHVPIIFVTAREHDQASVLRAYSLGAVDFLFTPLVPEVLRAKASVFVTLHERTEQLAIERLERAFENRRRDFETATLRRERDALEEYDRRKDSFLAILAHELRNPLAPLRTLIDLIHSDPKRGLTSKMVDVLERQTNVLIRLVDDLLDLSRIKADKIELRPEHVDLRDVVEAAIVTSRPLLEQRRHTLTVDAPSRQMVVVDSIRMTQVVCNLINNAARYTNAGGCIDVAVGETEEFAFIRVRDNGIGIPTELQDTIFNMFVQERVRSDGSGGLGLGLALARRLVELHRGSIVCSSEGANKGSTFEVRVPRLGTARALCARKRTQDLEPLRPSL